MPVRISRRRGPRYRCCWGRRMAGRWPTRPTRPGLARSRPSSTRIRPCPRTPFIARRSSRAAIPSCSGVMGRASTATSATASFWPRSHRTASSCWPSAPIAIRRRRGAATGRSGRVAAVRDALQPDARRPRLDRSRERPARQPFLGKVAIDKVAVMGHSCGGLQAVKRPSTPASRPRSCSTAA